ncbi:DNA-binding response regulator, OmpR family, contains REC and winged-helix (wHTH) domain [Amycolatopsis marina]|uniref:DNA-binding response regulator, OmpR family, contains REC and winged-helix (WHTH) domain n=1 Tax=Amycolatopsis marina TaxID=490629 RepID=A0A1I1AEQ4_9PSEU|nr:response regulator transcription factor [Amycolatopsis marina]SFB35972.1 DNA-binding response regulator, OmpR family, contains REC and winged-helix (wHTH) domain [Amycolatopsis marina]
MTADDEPRWRVLVAEDDEDLRVAITAELTATGLRVDEAADVASADAALSAGHHDCVVFDRMFPDGDATEYVHRRRQSGWAVPVLFLTARDSLADRVAGFEHGGDDYLVKPFAVAEMTARVLALCRRSGAGRPSILRHADLEMDCARRQVRRGGVLLTVSDKEFAVLEYLLARPEQAVGRSELIEHCWDSSTDPMSNVVDVVVRRLRLKLREPELIHTVRGRGYRLAAGRQDS